jgi:predicted DNA-binding transcriptional regulator AlpA
MSIIDHGMYVMASSSSAEPLRASPIAPSPRVRRAVATRPSHLRCGEAGPRNPLAIIGAVSGRDVRATIARSDTGWSGRVLPDGAPIDAPSRERLLGKLRDAVGDDAVLTVEVTPSLVGVTEAAALLGWDRRRVVTYVDRGSFPRPVAELASGRVWLRADVEAFARAFRRRQARRARRRASS